MSTHRMRSSWVAGDGETDLGQRHGLHRAGRKRRARPRRWMAATGGAATIAVLIAIAGTVAGVGASPALAVCDSSGGTCVDTTASASVAVLPLRKQGDDTLTVRNSGADGETEVGVVGFVTSDDASASSVATASPSTSGTVQVASDQRKRVRLSDVPSTARAVIVQVGSSYSRSTWAKSRAACKAVPASSGATTAATADATSVADATTAPTVAASSAATSRRCGTARVAFSGRHDTVDRAQIVQALRDFSARTATSMPTATAVAAFAADVDKARLAASIAPAPSSLVVSWHLDAGSDTVSAVRVTRSGPGGTATGATQQDRPARSGTLTLGGLTAGSSYSVTVAPVVAGALVSPITLTAAALASTSTASSAPATSRPTAAATASPSATASAQPSATPSATSSSSTAATTSSSGSAIPSATAYSGWTQVIAQNFDTTAALGSFASKYTGWAGYDGSTSGASGTTWNSATTMSVTDSVLRMRNWVSNGKAQAGALTPIVPGTGSWNQQGQVYGKYVVRFKADSVPGFKVAWLLWPTSNNWSDGEVDFPEADLNGTVNWSAHDVTGDPSNQTWGATSTKMGDGNWHTATTTWEPGKITYELDGAVVKTVTDSKFLPTKAMRWDLQNETSTDGTSPSASADGSVYIDWVAQYKRG